MKPSSITRLIAARSIALVGGAWADAVANASQAIGYTGKLWRVHPKRASTPEAPYFRTIDELPEVPDAAFLAAPNSEVPAIAAALARRGAGGFVCFAAGFSETATPEGDRLTRELVTAAAELPFFGPNCYGFINFFDGVALWPDQVVGHRRDRGVALICQSGTIALNLLFNDRSLPIGYVLTVGNQTRLAVEDMVELLAEDERVTAFGLYVEGIKDAARFAHAVARAREAGKPIAMVKAGRTEAAARTARSHTGSLAGADTVFDAFCRQAGIARCDSLATLCETLKVLHVGGPLPGRRVLVMGASGGDMAMTADAARDLPLDFAAIPEPSVTRLREVLTDKVHIANPFDFHTHIWFDRPALQSMFSVVQRAGFDAVGFMIDCPPAAKADPASYLAVIEEFVAAYGGTRTDTPAAPDAASLTPPSATAMSGTTTPPGMAAQSNSTELSGAAAPPGAVALPSATAVSDTTAPPGAAASRAPAAHPQPRTRAAVICSLPESLAANTRELCLAAGIVPLQGQRQALEALALAAAIGETWRSDSRVELRLPSRRIAPDNANANANWRTPHANTPRSLNEHDSKAALAAFGIRIPRSKLASPQAAADAATTLGFPVVIKAVSATLEHKSDAGGVALNIRTRDAAQAAARQLANLSDTLIIEEMITDAVAEILIGMTVDPQFGQVLVIGAGGVLAELLRDTATLLPPFTPTAIESALRTLAVGKLLTGYRGRPPGDIPALIETALACTRYAEANRDSLIELDINPVIVRPAGHGAIAVDALIRLG